MGCIVDDVMKIVLLAVALPCGFVVCICCIASERLNHDRSDLYSFEPLWWTRIRVLDTVRLLMRCRCQPYLESYVSVTYLIG